MRAHADHGRRGRDRRRHPRTSRALRAALGGGGLTAALLAASALGAAGDTAVVSDRDDTPVLLDIARVTLAQDKDGRLRTRVTTYEDWDAPLLLAGRAGPPGSVCLRMYTKSAPASSPPDYLACATPQAGGRHLRGTVLQDAGGGLPRRVGTATVTRPTRRSVEMVFSPTRIGRPTTLQFAAESSQPAGCPRPRGCVDRAPDGARTRRFSLRSATAKK